MCYFVVCISDLCEDVGWLFIMSIIYEVIVLIKLNKIIIEILFMWCVSVCYF